MAIFKPTTQPDPKSPWSFSLIGRKRTVKVTIDYEDLDRICLYRWNLHAVDGRNYVQAIDGNRRHLRLHRLIMNAPPGMDVDHIDGDGLNNRKSNLRICTRSQNLQNQKPRGGTSAYKGVCWCKTVNLWRAYIRKDGKRSYIGYFKDEMKAASAYDRTAKSLFGEFARVNFPAVKEAA